MGWKLSNLASKVLIHVLNIWKFSIFLREDVHKYHNVVSSKSVSWLFNDMSIQNISPQTWLRPEEWGMYRPVCFH